jgi:hypothetical protein
MKIKNNSLRNVSILGGYPKAPTGVTGGAPVRLLIPAGTTMEFTDEEFEPCACAAKKLIDLNLLEVLVPPVSKLTEEEIVAKIEKTAKVKVDPKLGKKKLQKVAAQLDVET